MIILRPACSQAPDTFDTLVNHESQPEKSQSGPHLVPVQLLPRQREGTSQTFEGFLTHLMIGVVQRCLIFAFFVLD